MPCLKQEKLNQQRLLAEKNEDLEKENRRLQRLVAVEESYVRLLENALEALGVMSQDQPISPAGKPEE